jgi:hypothetical protein
MLPVSPDGTVYLDAALTSVDIIAFDRRPASTPPPPYHEIVTDQTVHSHIEPPPAYSDITSHAGTVDEMGRDEGEEELEARQPLNPQQVHNDNNNTNQVRSTCVDHVEPDCTDTLLVQNESNGRYEDNENNNIGVDNIIVR